MIFVLYRNLLCEITTASVLEGNFRFNLGVGSFQVEPSQNYANQVETIQGKSRQVNSKRVKSNQGYTRIVESSRTKSILGESSQGDTRGVK